MRPEDIQRSLDAFEQDPRAAMDRTPEKRDRTGAVIAPPTAFSREDIESRNFVLQKDALRKRLPVVIDGVRATLGERLRGRAAIEEIDRPEDLVDSFRYAKLDEIDAAKLTEAALPVVPWSGDYWPYFQGILGRRYADPSFPSDPEWTKNNAYILAHPAGPIARAGSAAAIDLLSPAEKYDLLVGDAAFTLTGTMWSAGKDVQESEGKVEHWMGICDGWAAASYMLPRPRHVATAVAADGTVIRFYPDDLKALCSMLWARARTPARFIGSRCDDKSPKTDDNGRIIDPACFNENPGTFHLVAVNQIGVSRRAFIMDATFDYEVWNQPIFGYEYRYFNPQTMKVSPDLAGAVVERAAFTKDRFSKYRGQAAAAFAGVYMRVRYVGETTPSQEATNGPEDDTQLAVDYLYDLELDAARKIVGGEWYINRHPDFLWTPPPGVRAISTGDSFAMGQWDPSKPMPVSWQKAAQRAAEDMMPLAKILERLIVLANA